MHRYGLGLLLLCLFLVASPGTSTIAFDGPSDDRQPFEDCGTLVQGVECILFDSDNFGLYVLDNLGVFGVGDRVFVTGTLVPDCITTCLQGDGCIRDNTIEDCGPTTVEPVSWGKLKAVYRGD